MQWLVILPLEIVAASITINYWDNTHRYNHAIFVTVFLVLIVSINLCGVRGYGEAEFLFAIVKVIAVIGYMYVEIRPPISIDSNLPVYSALL
jgi:amino acid transporter